MVRGVDDVDAMKTGDVTQSGEVTAAAVVVDERRRAADTAALTVTAASDTDTQSTIPRQERPDTKRLT